MFFRRPLFYLAPESEGGGAVEEAGVEIPEDEVDGISDAEVAAADGKGEVEADTAAEPGDDSLAARVEKADLTEVWKQHGFDDLPADPAQLRAQYQAGLRAQQEAETYKNQLLWQMHNAQQMQTQLSRTPPAPPPVPAKVFNLPEFDPQWLSMVYTNEAGELVAKPGAQPDLPMKIQAFAKAREEANIKLLQDPVGTLSQHFMPIIQQQASAIAQQQLQEYARLREINQFEQQNAGWIFQNGTDNSQGLTPAAHRWNAYHAEALQLRHPNPVQYAQWRLDADAYAISLQEQQQQVQQTTTVASAKQKDRDFLKTRAAQQVNRGGSLPSRTTPKPPQNGKDPWSTLRKQISALPEDALDEK